MLKSIFMFVFASMVFLSSMANAQANNITGVWQCEQGIAPLRDTRLPTVYLVFGMELYQDGTMRAEGSANQNPFRAQGQWGVQQDGRFIAQGQMADALGQSPFFFSTVLTSVTTMNERTADQTNSVASQCQKVS